MAVHSHDTLGGKPAKTLNYLVQIVPFGNLEILEPFGLSINSQPLVIEALCYEFALHDHQAPVRDAKVATPESPSLTETSVLVVFLKSESWASS